MKSLLLLFVLTLGAYPEGTLPAGHSSACFEKIQAFKQGRLGSYNSALKSRHTCESEAMYAKNISLFNKEGKGDVRNNPFLADMQSARDTCALWQKKWHDGPPIFCWPVLDIITDKLFLMPEKGAKKK